MSKNTFWTLPRFTGLTLILGSVLFLTGAGMPMTNSKGDYIYLLPPQEWLQVVNNLPTLWLWTNILFIGGTVITLLGLTLFNIWLRDAGDRAFSQSGLLIFGLGFVFLIIHLAFRMSVDFWAAQEIVKTSIMPGFYIPLLLWIGVLFDLYTVLVILAAIAYGAALIFTRALPRWIGWTTVIYNIVIMGLFSFTGDMPPFVHQFLPILIGIILLLRQQKTAMSNIREEKVLMVQ